MQLITALSATERRPIIVAIPLQVLSTAALTLLTHPTVKLECTLHKITP